MPRKKRDRSPSPEYTERRDRPIRPFPPEGPEAANDTTRTGDEHLDFCMKVGIVFRSPPRQRLKTRWLWLCYDDNAASAAEKQERRRSTRVPAALPGSLYAEVLALEAYHNTRYHFFAVLINSLYFCQIAIGATATALGGVGIANTATRRRTTAITILTAIGTVITGVLASVKTRAQPHLDLRGGLRYVIEDIRSLERGFREPKTVDFDVKEAVNRVQKAWVGSRAKAARTWPDVLGSKGAGGANEEAVKRTMGKRQRAARNNDDSEGDVAMPIRLMGKNNTGGMQIRNSYEDEETEKGFPNVMSVPPDNLGGRDGSNKSSSHSRARDIEKDVEADGQEGLHGLMSKPPDNLGGSDGGERPRPPLREDRDIDETSGV